MLGKICETEIEGVKLSDISKFTKSKSSAEVIDFLYDITQSDKFKEEFDKLKANSSDNGEDGIVKRNNEIDDNDDVNNQNNISLSEENIAIGDDIRYKGIEKENLTEKVALLNNFIKNNKFQNIPLKSEQALNFTDGNLELAKDIFEATKEVITGKSMPELVDHFKLTNAPVPNSLSLYQTRIWYKWQESLIKDKLDYNKPLKDVARDAFNFRNEIRTKARVSMSNVDLANLLMKKENNWTFDDMIKYKMEIKKLIGDDIWKDIIKSSMKSRDSIDRIFKLDGE